MKLPAHSRLALLAAIAALPGAYGQRYLDLNGSTSGSGVANSSTIEWNGTNAIWADSTGATSTADASGSGVIVAAGSDATGAYTLNISGTQTTRGMVFRSGTPTLANGTSGVLNLVGTNSGGNAANGNGVLYVTSTAAGAVTVSSPLNLSMRATNSTTQEGALFQFVSNKTVNVADPGLILSGAITVSNDGASAYSIRIGGAGIGRIASALPSGLNTIAPAQYTQTGSYGINSAVASGTWTIAGNQSLGSASILYNASNPSSAGARLVMGDSASDIQTTSGAVNMGVSTQSTQSATLVVRSTFTSGAVTIGNGGLEVIGTHNATSLALGGSGTALATVKLGEGTTAGVANFSGTATVTGTGHRIVGNSSGSPSTITLGGGTLGTGVTLGGAAANENNFTLIKDGTTATLTVGNSANTYSGGTIVVNGQNSTGALGALALGADNALGSGPLTIGTADTGGNGARFRMAGFNQTVSALSSGTTGTRVIENNVSGASALTVNQSTDTTYSGILRNGSAGTFALTKSGAGTLTLDAINAGTTPNFNYTGATTINGGTLRITGAATLAGTSFTVNSTGTFHYDATVALGRSVTVSGGTFRYNSAANYNGTLTFTSGTLAGTNFAGNTLSFGASQTLAPGNSPGTMSAGATTFAGGGTYSWEINNFTGSAGANWDVFAPTSLNITASGGTPFHVNLASLTAGNVSGPADGFVDASNYHFIFVDAAAEITSFAASSFQLDTSSLANGFTGTWSIVRGDAAGVGGDSTQLYLAYTAAIPEPSSFAIVLGFAASGSVACRRKRRA